MNTTKLNVSRVHAYTILITLSCRNYARTAGVAKFVTKCDYDLRHGATLGAFPSGSKVYYSTWKVTKVSAGGWWLMSSIDNITPRRLLSFAFPDHPKSWFHSPRHLAKHGAGFKLPSYAAAYLQG